MKATADQNALRLALPKGRMQEEVFRLLDDAGIQVESADGGYRPSLRLPGFEAKLLKPQNVVEMLHFGSRDLGFAGADWVAELDARVVELLDTGLNPVQVVAAAPAEILVDGKLPDRPLVVASEYERLTTAWIEKAGLDATFVRTYGATEVFPPEDADCIVDNTATGSTLRAHRLEIVDELMASSTRLLANPKALENPAKREAIERFVLLVESVLNARQRVMLEANVPADRLEEVIDFLPCMRRPTVSPLYGEEGYAVKAAVPRAELPTLIPKIKQHGGSDIVITALDQLVP
ncbi:MAG: ATP phosphoribosyltransferase [Alphaproteobacteria bacterium]